MPHNVRSDRVPPRFFIKQHHRAMEEKVYETYRSHVLLHGKPPSLRLVGTDLGINFVTVMRHLDDLERAGRVKRVTHGKLTLSIEFPLEPTG